MCWEAMNRLVKANRMQWLDHVLRMPSGTLEIVLGLKVAERKRRQMKAEIRKIGFKKMMPSTERDTDRKRNLTMFI